MGKRKGRKILIYDEEMNVILIDYRETIKTENVNEQKTDRLMIE